MDCPYCNGTGKEFPDCKGCEGGGWVDDPSDGGIMICPTCGGYDCSFCEGTGEAQ